MKERQGELVKETFQYLKEDAVVGLSLEMGTLTYILSHDAKNTDDILYEKCDYAGPLSDAGMICPRNLKNVKHLSYSTVVGYVLDADKRHVFLGDSVKTVGDKVNYVKSIGPRKRIAWLLYDVHLTDIRLHCFGTPFKRVEVVKELFQKY